MWEDYEGVVLDSWTNSGGEVDGLRATVDKIKSCGENLLAWGSAKTAPVVDEIKMLTKKIEKMNEEELTKEGREEVLVASKKLDDFLLKQEIFWAQRSWVSWLKYGDRNTKFFHSKASQRRKRNFIHGIQNQQDMKAELDKPYSVEEVKTTLFQMGPTKAPRPDGMNALFYQRLGFPEVWINRVMFCVSTPSFSVRINGKAYGNIIPSRGLRQGDPLSPYLFLLCAKGFTSLLSKAESEGWLHGVQICRRAPCISNLLFADDSLIFCQANQEEVQVISETLQLYAETSGQCINFEKSSAYFSSNTSERQRLWIKQALGVRKVDRFDSYLGFPALVGRAKYQSFAYLKERVWKKLQGWKGRMLSRAGKEVLIKAVAQSIPTYTMGVFLLPVKLCNELDALCARFWWGQTGDERKIHWKS
ncbi:hypothetical protein SO802_018099 [Lithocarpus litseifolius]|uniref:Reverse transcriptase domain-containing protein n=1 Tax=Lithocarpus litseifolius TaxID=425828 RepID=A0AAW2CKB2_9ROSI